MVAVVDTPSMQLGVRERRHGLRGPAQGGAVEGTPRRSATSNSAARCRRMPTARAGEAQTWSDVEVAAIGKLAHWIAGLPEDEHRVISALRSERASALPGRSGGQGLRRVVGRALPSPPSYHVLHPPNDLNGRASSRT